MSAASLSAMRGELLGIDPLFFLLRSLDSEKEAEDDDPKDEGSTATFSVLADRFQMRSSTAFPTLYVPNRHMKTMETSAVPQTAGLDAK